jgi:uncharacterized protein (TIGR02391 family)
MVDKAIPKFPDEVLEYISEIIAGSRSGSEITRFFRSAGYLQFTHDGSTKKWFVLNCLIQLNNESDGPYHVAKIVEKLADPKQYIDSPETHRSIIASVNKALVFHSLHLNSENKVVVCAEPPPTTPVDTPSSSLQVEMYQRLNLHSKIKQVAEGLYKDGHYAQAIFEAFKAVNNAVKSKSGLHDKDGQDLMAQAFSGNIPLLVLNTLQTRSEREQDGFKFLFMGAMAGIRNPKAHENVKQNDQYRTLHYLGFASLLMFTVDECTCTKREI